MRAVLLLTMYWRSFCWEIYCTRCNKRLRKQCIRSVARHCRTARMAGTQHVLWVFGYKRRQGVVSVLHFYAMSIRRLIWQSRFHWSHIANYCRYPGYHLVHFEPARTKRQCVHVPFWKRSTKRTTGGPCFPFQERRTKCVTTARSLWTRRWNLDTHNFIIVCLACSFFFRFLWIFSKSSRK